MIQIDFCKNEEISEVKKFINNNWKKDHILARDNELLGWLYKEKDRFNFLLAKKNRNIVGLLGFIKNSHFDKGKTGKDIIWLALWKVIEDKAPPGLGLLMLKKLEKFEPNLEIAVLGINKSHPPMYRALKYFSGTMEHYYLINPKIKKFNIIFLNGKNFIPIPIISKEKLIYRELSQHDILKNKFKYLSKNYSCFKSSQYFFNKYLKHPIYKYKIFHLEFSKDKYALIVIRKINIDKTNILRVIDFEGDETIISYLGNFFLDLFIEEKAEYVDFMQYGIKKKYFLESGFNLLSDMQNTIIPNYFEPLIKKNIPLLFSYNLHKETKIRIFKGDGDQDRPNQVNKNE